MEADAEKESKGSAANGDWPIGAASCRPKHTKVSHEPPPPPLFSRCSFTPKSAEQYSLGCAGLHASHNLGRHWREMKCEAKWGETASNRVKYG